MNVKGRRNCLRSIKWVPASPRATSRFEGGSKSSLELLLRTFKGWQRDDGCALKFGWANWSGCVSLCHVLRRDTWGCEFYHRKNFLEPRKHNWTKRVVLQLFDSWTTVNLILNILIVVPITDRLNSSSIVYKFLTSFSRLTRGKDERWTSTGPFEFSEPSFKEKDILSICNKRHSDWSSLSFKSGS